MMAMCFAFVLLLANDQPPSLDAAAILERVHALDWRTVGAHELSSVTGQTLTREWKSEDECPAEIYRLANSEALRFRFDSAIQAKKCVTHLASTTYVQLFEDMGAAERVRTQLIAGLRAGGLPSLSNDSFEFVWRSTDSRTRFDLSLTIFEVDQKQQLKVILRQWEVAPASVDFLPFERGYFGCDCNRREDKPQGH